MKKRWILLGAVLLLLALLIWAIGTGKATPAAPQTTPAPADGQSATENAEMAVHFTTIAFDGTTVNESILSEASVTMINFFEPWCPPCIAELPELQKLYENYADKGFTLIGVYSTAEGTADVLADAGVGYPVLLYVPPFDVYQTGYVPTTVFLDAAGNQLGETVVGSRSYEEWEEIVKGLLG